MNALFITSDNKHPNTWSQLFNKVIGNEVIIIDSFNNIGPNINGPIFTCKILFMINCDKNFVYYWLDKDIFPNVDTIYLSSHPCELEVLERDFNLINLCEKHYNYYYDKWSLKYLSNIKCINVNDLKIELFKYNKEEMVVIGNTNT